MSMWKKILISIFLGLITGFFLEEKGIIFKPLGNIFLNLVHMTIIPLVFSSMTVGITGIHDPDKLGRIGLKTISMYLLTTLIAALFGTFFMWFSNLGAHLPINNYKLDDNNSKNHMQAVSLLDIIPSNPVKAMAEGNILQVIVFSCFLGMAINFSRKKGTPFLAFMHSFTDVMYQLTAIVMNFAPIAIFGIMTWVSGTLGMSAIIPLGGFLILYYFCCLLQILVVFCTILKLAKLKILNFFLGMKEASIMAFSTCSSSAALPISLKANIKQLGVSKDIANFVLPLGSTVNMNGSAIFQTMGAVFIAQAYGINLDLYQIITLIAISIFSAIGAAGVSGSGIIMMSVVFSSIGLPLSAIAIFAGIDRIREMGSTVVNVLGDSVVSVYIAKQEGELDEHVYNLVSDQIKNVRL